VGLRDVRFTRQSGHSPSSLGTDDVLGTFSPTPRVSAAQASEVKMTKGLVIVAALLLSGTSMAVAQNGPATGNEPPVAGGAAGNPILDAQSATPSRHYGTKHHRNMYMSARTHKGSKMNTTK
jgi:hypothetical protein